MSLSDVLIRVGNYLKENGSLEGYLLARAKEPSTWRGVALLVTSAGITISPEHIELLVSLGLFISGAIGALSNENNNSNK